MKQHGSGIGMLALIATAMAVLVFTAESANAALNAGVNHLATSQSLSGAFKQAVISDLAAQGAKGIGDTWSSAGTDSTSALHTKAPNQLRPALQPLRAIILV